MYLSVNSNYWGVTGGYPVVKANCRDFVCVLTSSIYIFINGDVLYNK